MASKKLKIAVIAPPWLSLYPGCFYGIENVVHHLAGNLTAVGHHVELFSVSTTKTKVSKLHWYHKDEQYQHIHRPYYEVLSISISHLLYALNIIRQAGDFDIIHDHNSFVGPAVLAYATDLPPILHTLHEPFTDERKLAAGIPDNRLMFGQFKNVRNLFFNTVSEKQKSLAPEGLLPRIRGVVYNAINPNEYIFSAKKDDYFAIVASMSPDKGQATAARAAKELGLKLKMAGTIGGKIASPQEAQEALENTDLSLSTDRFFRYFKEEVAPSLIPNQVEYVGKVFGQAQKELFSKARAFLFPIDWEEPFGMAVIEALASGTPVVAYNRGAMPEIIEHGVNGFLANNYTEFKHYIKHVGEIDPAECRKTVEKKFSTYSMTQTYVGIYQDLIKRYWGQRARKLVRTNLNKLQYSQPRLPLPDLRPKARPEQYVQRRLSL